jgi:hypothetical protein
MNVLRVAWRAWWQSVVACALFAASFAAFAQATTGRWSHLVHNVVDLTAAWTLAFAAVAATIVVPAFLILTRAGVGLFRPPRAMMLGAALGATAVVAFSMAFREGDDPKTIVDLIRQLIARPQIAWWLAVASLPFAVAGAVLGYSWSVQASGLHNSSPAA